LAGNMISPSRGLLAFTPVLVFAVVGIAWKIRDRQFDRLDRCLLGVMLLHWTSISSIGHWWGGWAFGPRLFSDMLPYYMYFLIPALVRIPELGWVRRRAIGSVFLFLTIISFAIHYRGATDADVFAWNATPVDVDMAPARLWDWHDIPFLRGIQKIEPTRCPLPKWNLWFVPNKTGFTFSSMFELVGYDVRTYTSTSEVSVILYWQALQQPDFDYSVFVHLIDESDQLVAQKDHAPGARFGYPPTTWQVGDLVADEHVIKIPPQLAPGTWRFRVGVYNWADGERLQIRRQGEPGGDCVTLDQRLSY